MTQIDPSQHGIHTLEELGAAEGAHILIAGEDGQGDLNLVLRNWLLAASLAGDVIEWMFPNHPPKFFFKILSV